MNFKLLSKVAFIVLSMTATMSSCNDNEDVEESSVGKEICKSIDLSEKDFAELAEKVQNDPNVEQYAIIDPNSEVAQNGNGLKTRYTHNPLGTKNYLTDMYGRYFYNKNHMLNDYETYYGDTYKSIPVDLNEGAGGSYCYLSVNFINYKDMSDHGDAVSSISAYEDLNARTGTVYVKYGGVFNCNDGTKKNRPISLKLNRVKDVGGSPITGIMIVTYRGKRDDNVLAYTKDCGGKDLNQGVGGRYIYIFTKK